MRIKPKEADRKVRAENNEMATKHGTEINKAKCWCFKKINKTQKQD